MVSGSGRGTASGAFSTHLLVKRARLWTASASHSHTWEPGSRTKRCYSAAYKYQRCDFQCSPIRLFQILLLGVESFVYVCMCMCAAEYVASSKRACEMLDARCARKSRGCVKVWSCTAIILVDPGTRCGCWVRHVPWWTDALSPRKLPTSRRPSLCGTTPPLCVFVNPPQDKDTSVWDIRVYEHDA